MTEMPDKPGLGGGDRAPNLPTEAELQARFWMLADLIRDAEASGDKATARRLERERRGISHQLDQSRHAR